MDDSTPAPKGEEPARYGFGDLRLEADGRLLRGETALELPAEELAALRLLLAREGEVVSGLELKRALFGEERAAGDRVATVMAALRARLEPTDCIQTIYKRGYRISVAVRKEPAGVTAALPRLAIAPVATGFGVKDYLGLAVFEETLALLNGERCTFASVMARDSVQTLARRGMDAREMGKTLRADLVLACTLNETQRNSRLRAEMIRVQDGAQLWTEDLLAKRGATRQLAIRLVRRLAMRMQGDAVSIAAAEDRESAEADSEEQGPRGEANELYRRAHHEWQTLERHQMQDAMQRLLQAIDVDPSLTAARIDLAYLGIAQGLFGFMPATSAAKLVHRAAEHVAEGAENADALLPALGWTNFHVDRDLAAAQRAFERSAHMGHEEWITRARTTFALSCGRFGEAIDQLQEAIQLDPYSSALHGRLAWALHLAGESDASMAQVRGAMERFGDDDWVHLYGAMILAYAGEAERACAQAEELTARRPNLDLATAIHAYALACAGRAAQARELLERLKWLSRERFVLSAFEAAAYLALGEADTALERLRVADENRCPWFFQMLADPRLKPLRGRQEYEAMRGVLAAMELEAGEGTQ